LFNSIRRPELIMIIGPVLMLLLVLELVRRRRLREDYSLLWLVTFGLLVILSLFRNSLLEFISVRLLGILYPPTALFVIGFGLLLLVMLQFSIVISRLSRQNQQAAQRIALLSARLHELEKRLDRQDAG
jgi:hypothetical protein